MLEVLPNSVYVDAYEVSQLEVTHSAFFGRIELWKFEHSTRPVAATKAFNTERPRLQLSEPLDLEAPSYSNRARAFAPLLTRTLRQKYEQMVGVLLLLLLSVCCCCIIRASTQRNGRAAATRRVLRGVRSATARALPGAFDDVVGDASERDDRAAAGVRAVRHGRHARRVAGLEARRRLAHQPTSVHRLASALLLLLIDCCFG